MMRFDKNIDRVVQKSNGQPCLLFTKQSDKQAIVLFGTFLVSCIYYKGVVKVPYTLSKEIKCIFASFNNEE